MSEFKVGDRVRVTPLYGDGAGSVGTVAKVDPEGTPWPINVAMDDDNLWGKFTSPFDPEELELVSEG